jgi:hypothetical protein
MNGNHQSQQCTIYARVRVDGQSQSLWRQVQRAIDFAISRGIGIVGVVAEQQRGSNDGIK